MSKSFRLAVGVLFIIAASVFLTPPFYSMLPMFKFEKIFNRLLMIFAVAVVVLLIFLEKRKQGQINKTNFFRETGFDFSVPWLKLFWVGFLIGALAVGFIIVSEVLFGPSHFRHPILLQDVIERFVKGMLTGVIVGVVEEFFFRGFIFNNLKKSIYVGLAVILSSAVYSMSHFFDNGQTFIPQHPSTADSFRLLFGYFEPFIANWSKIFPEFIGLFIFGIVLCIVFLRTKSLFMSIGIHAGAVFAIKFQHSFVRKGPIDAIDHFFGRAPEYDGPFEWAVLIILAFILWFWILPYLELKVLSRPVENS